MPTGNTGGVLDGGDAPAIATVEPMQPPRTAPSTLSVWLIIRRMPDVTPTAMTIRSTGGTLSVLKVLPSLSVDPTLLTVPAGLPTMSGGSAGGGTGVALVVPVSGTPTVSDYEGIKTVNNNTSVVPIGYMYPIAGLAGIVGGVPVMATPKAFL